MKKVILSLLMVFAIGTGTSAASIGVDSAPNDNNISAYEAWRTSTLGAIAAGTFVNMQNGTFPDSTSFAAQDIMSDPGTAGRRLQFVFFVPNTTKAEMQGRIGVRMSYDVGTSVVHVSGTDTHFGVLSQSRMFEVDGGVAGIFGEAIYAYDNDALPHSTDTSYGNEVDAADFAAVAQRLYDDPLYRMTYVRGQIAFRDTNSSASPWQPEAPLIAYLTDTTVVPSPAVLPGALALLGMHLMCRSRRSAA